MDATSTAPGEPSNQCRGHGGFWHPKRPPLDSSTPQTPSTKKIATPESRSILTATDQQRKEALEWLGYTTLYEDNSMSKLVDARFDLLPRDTAEPPPSISTPEKEVVPMQEWKPVCSFIKKRSLPSQAIIASNLRARQFIEPKYHGHSSNDKNLEQCKPLFYRKMSPGKNENESAKINPAEKKAIPTGKSENESGKIKPAEKKVIPTGQSENESGKIHTSDKNVVLTGNGENRPCRIITPQKEVSPTKTNEPPSLLAKRRLRYRKSRAKSILTPKNHRRHYVQHNYHDHSQDDDPNPGKSEPLVVQRTRGKKARSTAGFACKLYHMLEEIEEGKEYQEVVSWQPHGRAFLIRDSKRFVNEIMPKYFQQSKLSSFQRQVNLYGFQRLTQGPDRGAYYHELFLRGKPFLCLDIQRTKIKGTGTKAASSPETEPNLYAMPKLPPLNY